MSTSGARCIRSTVYIFRSAPKPLCWPVLARPRWGSINKNKNKNIYECRTWATEHVQGVRVCTVYVCEGVGGFVLGCSVLHPGILETSNPL